jgi:restriction system protein
MSKRKQSLLDDLVDFIILLPWKASVILAPISYSFLHYIAEQDFVPATNPENISTIFIPGLVKAFAYFGQFALPLLFLTGAAFSFIKKRQRQILINNTAQGDSYTSLQELSWQDFEKLVGEAYRQQGYQVEESGGSGPDGGVDLILKQRDETYFVQCKLWRSQQVGVKVVRELYGVICAKGAVGGMIVTIGHYTKDAKAFAHGRNIQLVDGTTLITMIKLNKQPLNDSSSTAESTESTCTPSCPKCGKDMVKRIAKKGSKAGNTFWGCSSYPNCRGTLSLGP